MSKIEDILSRLQNVKKSGAGWSARCPAHDDKHNSLSVKEDAGYLLLNCFAGCSFESVLQAVGFDSKVCFPENGNRDHRTRITVADLARDKELPESFLREIGLKDAGCMVEIAYLLADGKPAPRKRYRTKLKAKDGTRWNKGEGAIVPYGLWRKREGEDLHVVEGESDCWTLWLYGFNAIGIPGADMVNNTLKVDNLAGAEILYIHKEPDKGGETFIKGMADKLKALGWKGKAFVIKLPVKDANELHKHCKRIGTDFREEMGKAVEAATALDEPSVNEAQDDPLIRVLKALEEHGCKPQKFNGAVGDFIALCPTENHEGHNVIIKNGDDRISLLCNGDCPPEIICSALNLGIKDLSHNGEEQNAKEKRSKKKQQNKSASKAALLIELANKAALFHNAEGRTFATVEINDHLENYPIKSQSFRHWLNRKFYQHCGGSVSPPVLQEALLTIEARARFDSETREVNTRIAEWEGNICIDLCDAEWRVIEVSREGWRVLDNSPVRFLRARGMLSLPEPQRGGRLDDLQRFFNLRAREDWILLSSWLITAFRPRGPFPVLIIHGEQGSAKSTAVKLARALIDPNSSPLRSMPRDERDLMIAANNAWILSFDNLSHLSENISNALCRIATGGGFATRELYSDSDEIIFESQRPIILNGIEEIATRNDLLDRAIILHLPAIPDGNRRLESELWAAFAEMRPRMLGALLDAVSGALRTIDEVNLSAMPRMADFALWATAAEKTAGFEQGAFMLAYTGNREEANELALEASFVAQAVREFISDRDEWAGTATEMLRELNKQLVEKNDDPKRKHGWPQSPRALSNALKRLAPNLRAAKLNVIHGREAGTGRRIIKLEGLSSQSSHASEPKGYTSQPSTQLSSQIGLSTQLSSQSKPHIKPVCDDSDACDDNKPCLLNEPQPGLEEIEL